MEDTIVAVEQRVVVIAVFSVLGLFLSWIASKWGFYQLPPIEPMEGKKVRFRHVLEAFIVFLASMLILAPAIYLTGVYLVKGIAAGSTTLQMDTTTRGWINILAIFCSGIGLWICCLAMGSGVRHEVWGQGRGVPGFLYKVKSYFLGMCTWAIAYPWIIVVSQIIGIVLQFSYHGPHIDQIAVRHLKDALNNPLLLITTAAVVVLVVPVIEELMFRGFLQTWLKGAFGRVTAIIVTSIIFALFHFSSIQGVENFELLSSLFILSCFLGFIRERQGTLWASIGLHSTFNLISIALLLS